MPDYNPEEQKNKKTKGNFFFNSEEQDFEKKYKIKVNKKFKPKYVKPPEQIQMNLKESWFNRFFDVKRKIIKVEDRLKFSRFLRSFWVWLCIFIGSTATIISVMYIFRNWNMLPAEIPILKMFNTSENKLLRKEFLFFIAAIPLLSTALSLIFYYNIFKRNEKFKFLLAQLLFLASALTIYGLYSMLRLY